VIAPVGVISGFGLTTPLALWGLALVPLTLGVALLLRRRRTRYPVMFTNLDLLEQVASAHRRAWWRHIPLLLFLLALAAAAASVARPHLSLTSESHGALIMFVVDTSGSMQATDIAPSRLGAVVAVMQGMLSTLPQSTRVGLIGFSNQAEVLDAPTTNRKQVQSGLSVLTPSGGTALPVAMVQAVKVLLATARGEGIEPHAGRVLPAAVVVGTDGGTNRGTVSLQAVTTLAKTVGIRIFGVTVGTSHGTISRGPGLVRDGFDVPANPATVAFLARETGGQAYLAIDANGLYSIYHTLGRGVVRTTRRTDITSWFDLAAALLLPAGAGLLRLQVAALP
jgi:Ca-activated chloride channel homolog